MKKSIILSGVLSVLMLSSAAFADTQNTKSVPNVKKTCPCAKQMPPKGERPDIGARLNLTEEQKKQAHEIRMQGHEKMKPIFEKMQVTKQEIRKIKESELAQEEKDAKILPLKDELKKLVQEAKKVRIENTKQFESILTDEQKVEFEKIKQEGRERAKRYKQEARKHSLKNDK